jgi:hypothetical protein
MLADTAALTAVLGRNIDTQPAPETIKNPKDSFKSLAGMDPNHDVYRQIAEHINLDFLIQRCPKGFGMFASRVRTAIEPPT